MAENTWIEDDPRCEACDVPLTTSLMAAICPRREQCEFWPETEDGARWVAWMRGEPSEHSEVPTP